MQLENILSPFDGTVVGQVPVTKVSDLESVISKSVKAADLWRHTPAHVRSAVLLKAAALADERSEEIAQIISSENGKSLLEARGEASRSGEIIRLAAFEGSQLYGSTLPLDANKGTGFEKLGFTLRQPVGVVVAISPFNYPALLVLHKIAPALAVGNSVILKPARTTPLTAIALAKCFTDAGLPEGILQVVHGPGSELGNGLVTDSRVRKISFTGSTATGTQISSVAGIKKLSLELGSSCPVVVLDDADIDNATDAIALGGYINAGQVCISVQRVIVDQKVMGNFLDALKPKVEAIKIGDPKDSDTKVGTLINEAEAIRVETSIKQAIKDGATLLTGGERNKTLITPAIVCGVDPKSPFAQDELFGPAIAVSSADGIKEAIALANSTAYGLGAGVFTKNVDVAIQSAREIDAGIIHINWTPLWRADLMPYGGLKSSGVGKEGVRSTVNEMTEEKTIILHGRSW